MSLWCFRRASIPPLPGECDQLEEAADDALGVLLSRSMVLYDPAQQRWRLHDLMRDLAGGRAAVEALGAPADLTARLTAARRRHAGHYRGVLAAAHDLYLRGGAQVVLRLALFDLERRNIETGQAWAAEAAADDPVAARLCVSYPDVGAFILELRQPPRQRITWLERAAEAAREIGDRGSEGIALGNLGLAYAHLGETRRAIELYDRRLAIAREIGDQRGEGNALGNLGIAYADLGETCRAINHYEQYLAIAREIGDRHGEGTALNNLGIAYLNIGEAGRAITVLGEALVIFEEIESPRAARVRATIARLEQEPS
jgi:tetratricopeptide (TPR) repeat protein